MKLSELLEKYPHLRAVYDVLEPHLPAKADEIEVYGLDELRRFGAEPRDTVIAAAIKPNRLFFRFMPPDPYTFAHELIHLCEKEDIVHEEVYAYNLAELVVLMSESCVKANPLKLFNLDLETLNAAFRELGFADWIDFFVFQGIIPGILDLNEEGKWIVREGVTERDIVVHAVTELVAGAWHFPSHRRVLLRLLGAVRDGGEAGFSRKSR